MRASSTASRGVADPAWGQENRSPLERQETRQFTGVDAPQPLRGAGAFTCTTVARRLQLDPEGRSFSNVFRDDLDVNQEGDVVFAAKADDGRERLYLYRGDGTKEVVAEAGGPGPAGIVFRVKRPFADLEVGFDGSVSFVGRDSSGRRVLVSRSRTGV